MSPAGLDLPLVHRRNFGNSVDAESWDGPTFRPTYLGYAVRYVPGMEVDFVLNAGRQDVVWLYVVRGALEYSSPNVDHVLLTPGYSFFGIQPHQGKIYRLEGHLPVEFLVIQVGSPLAISLTEDVNKSHGCLFEAPPDCPAVRMACHMVDESVPGNTHDSFYWSVKTYEWFLNWLSFVNTSPESRKMAFPLPSRVVQDPGDTLKDFARKIGYSPAHISRKLKKMWGATPGTVMRSGRMEEAARMLRVTDRPVRDIAKLSGYKSASAFNHAFVKHFGETPLCYRHAHR